MTLEELKAYGLEEMTDDEIRTFLTNRGFGVLGLPTDGAPYLVPLSFGYGGGDRLYFSYFVGEESQKAALSDRAEAASFLVFKSRSVFRWTSVSLTGEIERLSEDDLESTLEGLENAWHLDLLERADTAGRLQHYQFRITDQRGIKSVGLPPELERVQDDAEGD